MPAAVPRPESQEEILDAALAALTDADIPPDEDARAAPDPDCGRPAELADLTTAELDLLARLDKAGRAVDAAAAAVVTTGPTVSGPETADTAGTAVAGSDAARPEPGEFAGFAQGGVLDLMAPGVPLAGFADAAHAQLSRVPDNELVGVLAAWRRQTSWAQARELAVVAELARRRPAGRAAPAAAGEFPVQLSEFVAAEVALALTLTRHGGEGAAGAGAGSGRPARDRRRARGGPD